MIPESHFSYTKYDISKFFVSSEDASKFAKFHRPNEIYKIEPYIYQKDTLMYIVNYNEGWLVIAGDNRLNPVVAFSEKENLSTLSTNKNLMIWLDSYADEIKVFENNTIELENEYTKFWNNVFPNKSNNHSSIKSSPEYKWVVVSYTYNDSYYSTIVPQLITTKWGQGAPWNTKLPMDTRNGSRCITGCVAVSIGQIVNYMHNFLGKPNALYHNISISTLAVNNPSTFIGFSRSNFVSNSTRWNMMATDTSNGNTSYAGDLMLDVGNHVNMCYSGVESSTSIVTQGFTAYNLACDSSSYDFQRVKTNLLNRKPINILAFSINGGHSCIIDGLAQYTIRYVTEKHFEYTENWMHESEYYNSFDEIRAKYHVNSEFDYIEEVYEQTPVEYLKMNWGYNGNGDDAMVRIHLVHGCIMEFLSAITKV